MPFPLLLTQVPSPHPIHPSSLQSMMGPQLGPPLIRGLTPTQEPGQPGDCQSWRPTGTSPTWGDKAQMSLALAATLPGWLPRLPSAVTWPVSFKVGPQSRWRPPQGRSRGECPHHWPHHAWRSAVLVQSWRAGPARGARSPAVGFTAPL